MTRYSFITTAVVVLAAAPLAAPSTAQPPAPVGERCPPAARQAPATETAADVHREVLDRYCATCHNARIVRGEAGGASPLRNPRRGGVAGPIPVVNSVTIRGPYDDRGAGGTPSRRRVFVCLPETPADEPACAAEILTGLARRAYRPPATAADVSLLRRFYDDARAADGDFEGGIERARRYLLASPDFLFRFESDPVDAGSSTPTCPRCAASCAVPRRQPTRPAALWYDSPP